MVATNSAIIRASSLSFLARTPRALANWRSLNGLICRTDMPAASKARRTPRPARAGRGRGREDRPVRERDRGPARLDRAAALVGEHARAAPLRRAAAPAPGTGHHRAVAARFDRQGAAS